MHLLTMIAADFRRSWRISLRYPIEFLVTAITLCVLYAGVYWANRVTAAPDAGVSPGVQALARMLMWYLLSLVIGSASSTLESEAEQGTLEQLWLTPATPAQVVLSRLVAVTVRGALEAVVIFGLLAFATRLPISYNLLPVLPVLVISLAGLTGFGYALAGLTLLYKRTAGLTGLVNLGLLILIGIFGGAGSGLLGLLIRVVPLAYGAQLLEQVLQTGHLPAGTSWTSALLVLTGNATTYIVLGIAAFRAAEQKARRRGVLAQF